MSLLVQNDTGTVANANSYVTVQEFKDYWAARGVDYSALADSAIEALLIPACSYLDTRFKFAGYKLAGRDQTTQFPRSELYDCSGEYPVLVAGVPREVKEAQIEYSKIQNDQGSLQPNGSVKGNVAKVKKKVGPIESEYEYSPPGEAGSVIAYPQADNKIPDCFISPASSESSNNLLVHT
jgi:hypothetical protein